MPDDGAVATLEAPAADAGLVESSAATDISTDTSSSSGTGTTDAIDNSDTPVAGESGHLRGAELYKSVKEKLKAGGLSAAEQRSIRNAIHIADKADKLSGGNLEAFEAERGILAKLSDDPDAGHTPEQIVQNTLEERKFWRDFDSNFQKADGQIIKDMIAANSESFQKLVPMAMDEFAEVNPDAFSGYVARSAKGYLDGKQIPLKFAILETFLPSMPDFPGKDRVVEAIQAIYGAFDGLDKMAKNPITPKKAEGQAEQPGTLNQNQDTTEGLTIRANRAEWQPAAQAEGIKIRTAEMNRVAAQQKVTLDDADREKIRVAVNEEVNTRLSVNERYKQAMRQYLLNGNRKAYVDRATSEQQKIVAGITQRHTQAVIDAKKAAGASSMRQNGNVNGQKTVQNAQPTKDGAGNLIQWLSGHPKTLGKQVDLRRTTNGMLARQEAYLVGEKGLYKWRPKTA